MPSKSHAQIVADALELARPAFNSDRLGATPGGSGEIATHDWQKRLTTFRSRLIGGMSALRPVERKYLARYVLDMYEGGDLAYINKWEFESASDFEDRLAATPTLRVSACVANSCAGLYGTPAKRTAPAAWGEAFIDWATRECLDEHMQGAERYGFLCGTLALIPMWYADEKRVTLDIVTPDKFDVVENEFSRSNPHAVVVQWPDPEAGDARTDKGANGGVPDKAAMNTRGMIYTREEIIPLRNGAPAPLELSEGLTAGPSGKGYANPYKVIGDDGEARQVMPVVLFRYRTVTSGRSFFVEGEGQYLADLQASLTQSMRGTVEQLRAQGYSQVYMTGVASVPSTLKAGPHSAWMLPSSPQATTQPEIGALSLDDHVQSHMMWLEWALQVGLQLAGLPKVTLESSVAQSGASIKAASGPLTEFREASRPRMARLERSLALLWAAIEAAHNGGPVPRADDVYSVDFAEPAVGMSPKEERELEDADVEAGYKHIADVMVQRNPDAYLGHETPEAKQAAALADIKENLRVFRELRGAPVDPNDPDGNGQQPPGEEPDAGDMMGKTNDERDTATGDAADEPAESVAAKSGERS